MPKTLFRSLLITATYLLSAPDVNAEGVSPYLPLKIDANIEVLIEQVFATVGGAPMTRPFKVRDLNEALQNLPENSPIKVKLTRFLQRYDSLGVTHFAINGAVSNDTVKALPNQRGKTSTSNAEIRFGGIYQPSAYFFVTAGSRWDEEQGISHWDSHITLGHPYAQLDIGYREHWFSPLYNSAMVVSTHAKASPSITLSNGLPITGWRFRYELFYSELHDQKGIRLGDQLYEGKPSHAGLHIGFEPINGLSIGLSRTLQFGGGPREVTVGDFFEALFDPAGKDNVGDYTGDDPNYEFGNQQASITFRYVAPTKFPFSIYGEVGGEDTQYESNYRLGNQTQSLGVFLPALPFDTSLRYEFSRWTDAWYTHHLYADGYTNYGQVMGHWVGTERVFNHAVPSQVHSINFTQGGLGKYSYQAALHFIENEVSERYQYHKGYEAELNMTRAAGSHQLGATLYAGKTVFDKEFTRLELSWLW